MDNIVYPVFSREQLHIFDNMPSGVLVIARDGEALKYVYSNPFLAESLDYTHEEFKALLTENCFAAIYEADMDKSSSARTEVLSGKIVDSISRQKKKDGSFVWILAHIRRIEIDGCVGMFFLFSRIQELIGLQNDLSQKNDVWNDIIKSVPIGLWVFRADNGVRTTLSINDTLVNVANAAGAQIDNRNREWTEAEIAMLLNQDLYAFCENEDIHLVDKMLAACEKKPIASCIFRLRGSSRGNTVYIYTTCATKKSEDGSRTYYVTFQNVTKEETNRHKLYEKQELLYQMSYYDALTGVKNRNAYNEFVHTCKENVVCNVGFAFCDLNGLKQINDTLGHTYGDRMIIRFTEIVKEYFEIDNIFRISGDEFLIIVPGIMRSDFQDRMDALIEKMQEADNLASIGYVWKNDATDITRRTQQAEQLMYVEKQRYYEASRYVNSKHRPRILESLLKEFEEGRFVMFLQPKTSIDGTKIIGAEALARRIDEDGTVIPPYEFVPQLEHEKLIPKLDFYIMEQACKFLQARHVAGDDEFTLSVNVSRVTIVENDFINTVISMLDKYDFLHSNLEFELTESNKTMDSFRLEDYLSKIKDLGIKVSIDDMGTEYSTLGLLTLEGINWVKLDRSLVIRVDNAKVNTLLKHVINMCHDLDMKVIAEGVETDDIRLKLMEMGCDAYQGYLTSKPIPKDEFVEKFL